MTCSAVRAVADPTMTPVALDVARTWAAVNGQPAPDDELLQAYGRALLNEVRTALADTLRRIATGAHDAGLPYDQAERDAVSGAYRRAAQLVDSVLLPTEGGVAR